jgi:predicted  nucleic acid-binding Zn-ribbon protein
MSDLKQQLIRLGSVNPELRPHIRQVLAALTLKTAASFLDAPIKALEKAQNDAESKLVSLDRHLSKLSDQDIKEQFEIRKQIKDILDTVDKMESMVASLKTLAKLHKG